eukprot:TRINITY_DN70402_c0_g1_i1.p1 TRINITY_DN70402_c0_g1~~TRINITY_DN70402_c0_g1_i1.p1  ORF type:complete len:287 (-),score=20.35 TRINITY_DN70402_c0_g1_i1:66-833(-)
MGGLWSASGDCKQPQDSVLEEVSKEDPAWRAMVVLVDERSASRAYNHSVIIKRLHRVKPSAALAALQATASSLGQPTMLFHGTRPESAAEIIRDGFKLPKVRGMFGKGIYFAKDPLKSVNYARKKDVTPGTWLYNLFVRTADNADCWLHMLLCDVYLGKVKTLRRARHNFTSENLRRCWLLKALGFQDFNSVRGASGLCGAVRVEEFVVYEQYQGIPRFLIEFEKGQTLPRKLNPASSASASCVGVLSAPPPTAV